MKKFIDIIKKKWLISGTKTIVMIAILVAIFVLLNTGLQKLDLTPIDLTTEKLNSLTDTSKEKLQNIDKDVNIYFVGYTEDDQAVDLVKQYKNVNDKINVELVDTAQRPDLVQKYGIESGSQGIIVECGDNSRVLTVDDLYTYDNTTYEEIDITEEKITSSILTVATEDVPTVYFLNGYSNFSLENNMTSLYTYLGNEVMNVKTLDLLVTGEVPEDCKTLIITTPNADFDDLTTSAIEEYISNGGNILWFNGAYAEEKDMPNVASILELYGVQPFSTGIILETEESNMILNSPDTIIPEIQYAKITEDIFSAQGAVLTSATKINLVDDEDLEELGVGKTDLIKSTDTSFFRTDFSIDSLEETDADEEGEFILGTLLDKEIDEDTHSKLVIYGENYFISDYAISQSYATPFFYIYNNKDLAINSMVYLTDREQDITIRKTTGTVTYTATEEEDKVIKAIIFTVPVFIILIGIVVWIIRGRKK